MKTTNPVLGSTWEAVSSQFPIYSVTGRHKITWEYSKTSVMYNYITFTLSNILITQKVVLEAVHADQTE